MHPIPYPTLLAFGLALRPVIFGAINETVPDQEPLGWAWLNNDSLNFLSVKDVLEYCQYIIIPHFSHSRRTLRFGLWAARTSCNYIQYGRVPQHGWKSSGYIILQGFGDVTMRGSLNLHYSLVYLGTIDLPLGYMTWNAFQVVLRGIRAFTLERGFSSRNFRVHN